MNYYLVLMSPCCPHKATSFLTVSLHLSTTRRELLQPTLETRALHTSHNSQIQIFFSTLRNDFPPVISLLLTVAGDIEANNHIH